MIFAEAAHWIAAVPLLQYGQTRAEESETRNGRATKSSRNHERHASPQRLKKLANNSLHFHAIEGGAFVLRETWLHAHCTITCLRIHLNMLSPVFTTFLACACTSKKACLRRLHVFMSVCAPVR